MKKQTILFFAANPRETGPLALDREARAIQTELQRSSHGDQFDFVTRWAPEPLDLLRELRRLRPEVVHFSGHGKALATPSASDRKLVHSRSRTSSSSRCLVDFKGRAGEPPRGLFFQAADGTAQLVSPEALVDTFGAAGASVKLVVLNACYSAPQAEALLAHVDCVVGMSSAISDDAARHFAVGFYGGLAERESVAAACRQGRTAISLEGLHDEALPQLKVRRGVNPDKLILASDPRPSQATAGRDDLSETTEAAQPIGRRTWQAEAIDRRSIARGGRLGGRHRACQRSVHCLAKHPNALGRS